jgi:hypothetical protein
MQKTIAILTLVFLFFFSSSCMTSNLQHSNPDNESNIIKETRAFITTKEIKAKAVPAALIPVLIGAVAPVAIDKGIDFLGALLKAAAEREEVTRAAFVNDHFYFLKKARLRFNVAPPAKELIIIHGKFGPADKQNFKDKFWEDLDAKYNGLLTRSGLIEDPDFYFSGKFDYSPDGSSFRLKATLFEYRQPFGKHKFAHRDIALTLVFQTPYLESENSTVSSFALGTFTFKNLAAPIRLQEPQLRGKETKWLSILNFEGDLSNLRNGPVAPYTVVATIAETRDANKFLMLASEIFEESKEDVKDIIAEPINP